jgi:hypothetical protein
VSETTNPEHPDPGLPEGLIMFLRENGIDISDEKSLQVARLTFIYTNKELVEDLTPIAAKQAELLRMARRAAWFLIPLGLASAILSLIVAYKPFVNALKSIFQVGMNASVISTAYAQSAHTLQNPVSLAPVLIYLIYALFSIAYVFSIITAFVYCKTPRMQANAFDSFKLLTAFFIGAATGHA